MTPTTVVNMHVRRSPDTQEAVYIGRARNGMHYGNPFSNARGTLATVRVRTRNEAIARYRTWLTGTTDQDVEPERRAWILKRIPSLRGRVLECFCRPRTCHGDVLAELAAAADVAATDAPAAVELEVVFER